MKKIFTILVMFIFCLNVNAKDVQTFERTEDNNYGVIKKFNKSDLDAIMATDYVDSSVKVYDFADKFTDDEEEKLYDKINAYIEKYKMDLAVLTIDKEYSSDDYNKEYAADFYDYNDFGATYDKYSGLLIFINFYENDRYYFVLTTGSARLYYDDDLESIYDDSFDYFADGEYYNAVTEIIDDLDTYYEDGETNGLYLDENGNIKYTFVPSYGIYFIISVVVTTIIIWAMISKNKMVKYASEANNYLDKKSINYTKKTKDLISSVTIHHKIDTSSSSGGHHSSGGGFSGSSGFGHGGGSGRHF